MNKKENKPIYVTSPSLPPLKELIVYLEQIWENKWITNDGDFHQEFERKLADFLGVKYISLFTNGTLALITALQELKITGEVITTPYSFVASTHALWWNGIKPIFADIEPEYCTIDPDRIEAAITAKTTAIVPVHVYGNPCDVDKIQKIADTYGLKVVYDAAPAFGVEINNKSLLNHGDLSVLSFHATKTFNTIEGGAIICHDEKTKKRIDFLKNFGIADETTVIAPGINAKMNELQAAYGLLQLKTFNEQIAKRKIVDNTYRKSLKNVKGITFLKNIDGVKYNYAYFPILIDQDRYGLSRDELFNRLLEHNIFSRRYYYPLISNFSAYKGLDSAKLENLPIANRISNQVICLPIYPAIENSTVKYIVDILTSPN